MNCINLSELVRSGKLDFLLMLPINTGFCCRCDRWISAASSMPRPPGRDDLRGDQTATLPALPTLLGFGALCLIGICIHYCLMFSLATVSFWTVRAQGIVYGYYNLFNIARMPDDAFRSVEFSARCSRSCCQCCWFPMCRRAC